MGQSTDLAKSEFENTGGSWISALIYEERLTSWENVKHPSPDN
jgi:hypothetical protein